MIYLILILAALLRMINLNQSLWLDEAINIISVKSLGFWETVLVYPRYDFHPPGYFALMWGWARLFGDSEISVRLPSVIFGVTTVVLCYLISTKLFSRRVALLAAFFLAINPLHIYYSQEARMYAFSTFAVALNYYFFIKLFKGGKGGVGFVISLILVMMSDYVAYFILPAQLIFLTSEKKQNILKWVKLVSISSVVMLLWLPFFIPQFRSGLQTATNTPGWRQVVGSTHIKDLGLIPSKMIIGRISLANKNIYYPVIGLLSILFAVIIFNSRSKLLLSWLILPVLFVWLVSFFIPILSYFRLLYLSVPFVILLSLGLNSFPKIWQKSSIVFVAAIFAICSLLYLLNSSFHREDWLGLSRYLSSQHATVLIENNQKLSPLDYYGNNSFKVLPALTKAPITVTSDLIPLDTLPDKIYYLEYLIDITDPHRLLRQQLERGGFNETDILNFRGVGLLHVYEK